MSDKYQDAKSALTELTGPHPNHVWLGHGQTVLAALAAGQKAERGLEMAIERLADFTQNYVVGHCPLQPPDKWCSAEDDCQACWKQALSQPTTGEL